MDQAELARIEAERQRVRDTYLRPDRDGSSARGLHHVALLSSDVARTVRFYQDLLGFPLTEIFENRDYPGSNHFFWTRPAWPTSSRAGPRSTSGTRTVPGWS
jgi:hypothetical protein